MSVLSKPLSIPPSTLLRLLTSALTLFTFLVVYRRARARAGCPPVSTFVSKTKISTVAGVRRGHESHRRRNELRVDRALLRRVCALLRLCFPSAASAESALLLLLAALLTLRTTLTLTLARVVGQCTGALVARRLRPFVFAVADLALLAVPASVTAAGVHHTVAALERRFRFALQRRLHAEYFTGHALYQLAAGHNIDNPAQRLTQDTERFSSELARLLPAVVKPIIDIVIFAGSLAQLSGGVAPVAILTYYAVVAAVLRASLPNFAASVARSREKEANLRTLHTQLVQHAEEVAFYRGADAERENADRLLHSYTRVERHIKVIKWWTSLVNMLLVKYGATCVGYAVCALAVQRARGHESMSIAALTQLQVQSTQLYVPLSLAIGQLLGLHLKVGALCSSAHRIGQLRDVLQRLTQSNAKFQEDENGTVVVIPIDADTDMCEAHGRATNEDNNNASNSTYGSEDAVKRQLSLDGDAAASAASAAAAGNVDNVSGEKSSVIGPYIAFRNATIASPSDCILIEDLNLTFRPGQHVLVTGSNGSGKSAMIRTIGGLWPLAGGTLVRPPLSQLLFLTQRVYLPQGTLRTQLIYPALDTAPENTAEQQHDGNAQSSTNRAQQDGKENREHESHKVEQEEEDQTTPVCSLTDAALLQLAAAVGLSSVITREGGLDAVKDWNEVLSGGERQRVALVRVLAHKPLFAFLDECTSAVSQDVEPALYARLQESSTTFITVSHREALRACHPETLVVDGYGGYTHRKSCDEKKKRPSHVEEAPNSDAVPPL